VAINDATINKWANMLPGSTSHKDKSPTLTREARRHDVFMAPQDGRS